MSLDKYIQMLNSSKADTRFDGCEQLRVARESSEAAVLALEKVTQDKEKWVADAAKNALDAEVHQETLVRLGLRTAPEIPKETKELSEIIIVTTPTIEGRKISQYLEIVSSEVVLGTGFLSELNAEIADMLGDRADKFQEKLKAAKTTALTELRKRGYALHANAIVGVDLDYAVLGRNMLMVVANGTAVILEPLVI